jgi:hypothetical protein
LALDAYLELKGKPIERKKRARISVDNYRKKLALLDKKSSTSTLTLTLTP